MPNHNYLSVLDFDVSCEIALYINLRIIPQSGVRLQLYDSKPVLCTLLNVLQLTDTRGSKSTVPPRLGGNISRLKWSFRASGVE